MYRLTNIQNGEVTKIENIFDVMTFLDGVNYDSLKSETKPEVVHDMMTNHNRHAHSNLTELAINGGCVVVRGQKNYDIIFEQNA